MAQSKMKFGIDLGTTNSAICKMEGGEPVIKKTDTLKDTLPSCVSFTRKKVVKVGFTLPFYYFLFYFNKFSIIVSTCVSSTSISV